MSRFWPVTLVLASVVVVLAGNTGVARAAGGDGCSSEFPFLEWQTLGAVEGIEIRGASIPAGQHERFVEDVREVAALLSGRLPVAEGLDVCLVGPGESLREAGLKNEFQTVNAVALGPEQVVAIDTGILKAVDAGIAYGVTYLRLWNTAVDLGLDSYPEPLASTVAHWVTSQVRDREELHHAQIRTSLFFTDPEGVAESRNWVEGAQQPLFLWNPEFTDSPIGDLVGFAVETRGDAVLAQPDGALWADIEQEWRSALREELLEGATGERFWRIGLGIVVGVLALSIGLAWHQRIVNRREAYRVGETEPIPGFFEST